MKKISLLLFVVSMFPTVSLAYNCTPASPYGNGYEYSECAFLSQPSLTDAVKSFWGNPKVSSLLASNGDTDDFVLTRGVHCGTCGDDSTASNGYKKFSPKNSGYLYPASYKGHNDCTSVDDEALLAYVATDVSEHGAEFCLMQFTTGSWNKAKPEDGRFFVYHQTPKTSDGYNKLECAWYCESGYGGDRCMKRGINAVCDSTFDKLNNVLAGYKGNACRKTNSNGNHCLSPLSGSGGSGPAAGVVSVLDYKYVKDSGKIPHQQQIVIGAIGFLEYGIKASPVVLSAGGKHNACPVDNGHSEYTHIYSNKAMGGKEHILCLQGYVLQGDQCVKACGDSSSIQYCSDWRAGGGINFNNRGASYYENKPDTYYVVLSDNCKQIKCRNGMNFASDDEYACTFCKDTVQQGLCRSTNKCKWCAAGQCFNPDTCKCDACSSVVTKEQMRFGPNKTDECWSVIDADDFRACVIGDTVSE